MSGALIWGSLTYFLLKLTGYSLFSIYLNKIFAKKRKIFIVGVFRTFLGVSFGLAVNLVLFASLDVSMGRSPIGGQDTSLYLFSVFLLRIVEWSITVFVFYEKRVGNAWAAWLKGIGFGTLCSFILDIPVMLGLLLVIATIC